MTTAATWTSSAPAVATVDASGRVAHLTPGTTDIRAAYQGLTGSLSLAITVVTPPSSGAAPPSPGETPQSAVVSISVSCMPASFGDQCTATAALANGSKQDVTSVAAWSSSNTSVATVDSSGHVTPIAVGKTEIRATYKGVIGGTTLNTMGSVTSISITCSATNDGYQCAATGRQSNNFTRDLTSSATWTSSNRSVAIVNSAGHVAALADGQADITATYFGIVGGTVLTFSGIVIVPSGAPVVINEFRTRGPDSWRDEFIELRNDSPSPVDISGWRILKSSALGATSVYYTIGSGVTLAPGCHYLMANGTWSISALDARTNSELDDDGGIALVRPDGSIVDQVGMSFGSAYKEGVPLPPMTSIYAFTLNSLGSSYGRVGGDTNNNSADFLGKTSGAQNSSSSCSIR